MAQKLGKVWAMAQKLGKVWAMALKLNLAAVFIFSRGFQDSVLGF
jgi:hypothetical protein